MSTTVTTKGKDENDNPIDVVLTIKPPSAKVHQEARIALSKAYGEAAQKGVLIKQQMDALLRKSSLWDDDREAEFKRLKKSLLDGELALEKGQMDLSEARAVAIRMFKDRGEINALLSVRVQIEEQTADAIAEQAMFNYYVASCVTHRDGRHAGKPYFTTDGVHPSVDVYLERSRDQDAVDAALKVREMLYGGGVDDSLKGLPEAKFLLDYGFIDDDFNYIDEDGKRVDEEGRLLDKEGFLIDSDGHRVDTEGRRVDENGRFVVEFKPFLGKDGKPVQPKRKKDEEPKETVEFKADPKHTKAESFKVLDGVKDPGDVVEMDSTK